MRRISITLGWIMALVIILYCFLRVPNALTSELKECYYHLCLQLVIYFFLWICLTLKCDIDILEPIVLFTVIHILLFEITPLVCLHIERISFFGTYVWGGCVKGTYISTLGYLVLTFSYFGGSKREKKCVERIEIESIQNVKDCLMFNYIIWLIAFTCNMIVILGYGLNFRYVLTGGRTIIDVEEGTKSNFGFLVIIAYAMIPSFLYIFEYGRSKIAKFVLFYLMFMSFYVRGFRFIMIAVIMAPLVLCALKKNKRPGLFLIVLIFVGLTIFSGYMQFARMAIRSGIGGRISLNTVFNFENIATMLIDNFEIVKTYYAIVEHIPRDIFYLLGAEMIFYTLILFVPRFIWSGKPQPPIYQIISHTVNSSSREAGTSYPYLGEYYFEFGVIGVCVLMFVMGKVMKKLQTIMWERNFHALALYSCIYPLILQVLIRGYTPTNFYMILAVIMPIVLSKRISKQSN